MTDICRKCKSEVHHNFCSICGAPRVLNRINAKYIFHEIGSVLNFEKGILFTIKELLLRPGANIRTFILEDRNRLVKPIVFVIIASLIYMIAQQLLHFEDGYVQADGIGASSNAGIFNWIQNNYGYANILMALFIGGWIKIFFRKYQYNYFEILIMLCFVMGMGMLMYAVFGVIESTAHIRVLHIGGMIGVLYSAWAIGQFFDKNRKVNYLKGLLSYVLGMITFFLVAILIGVALDRMQGM